MTHPCAVCGTQISGDRKKYCANKCRTAAYKLRHPDTAKRTNKDQYWKNREKRLEDNAKWREDNKDYLTEYNKTRTRRSPNRVKRNEYQRRWKELNPDKVKTYNKTRYWNHIDEMRAKHAEYCRNNLEKIRAYNAAKRKENPELHRIRNHNRDKRIKENGGKLSAGIITKLLKLQKGKCSICKRPLSKTGHHLDHIVPLSKGGANKDSNVQLTCPRCNIIKKDKDPIKFMQSLGYLL